MTDAAARLAAALSDRYRLERELGQGGMATVYLAQDLRHDRKVAVKVLRPELSAILGAERFLQEIKTTANLQHPHILALHDSGEAGGSVFYVMPFVDGESLRDRLRREKQLPVEDAVRIAREVADALDYAHRHGVVHRDIKPENILLHGGHALVADFGIALAASRSEGGTRMTETGMSLGTPHYMAPEQAMGEREITPKADIYALGCVLYEMLTGEPPFTGPTAQAIVARVMTEEPRRLTLQRRTIPPHVEAAVDKALAKLPADRFTSAAQFGDALANASFQTVAAVAPRAARRRDWRPWAIGAALLLAGALLGRLLPAKREAAPAVARFRVSVEAERGFTGAPVNTLALSPDGRIVVYVGRTGGGSAFQLYARRLSQLDAFTPIPGTENGASPAFSPDGSRLAFVNATGIQVLRVPFTGAPPTPVQVPALITSATAWLDDATLVTTGSRGQVIRAGLDGTVTTIAEPDTAAGERNIFVQATIPGRGVVLATASRGTSNTGPGIAIAAGSGKRTAVLATDVNAIWYADGYLLWSLPNGALQAAPFDERRLRLKGPAVTLAEGVRQAIGGGGQAAVSRSGALVYLPEQPFSLMLVDRAGRREIVADGHRFHSPRFSPDGRRLALDFIQQGARDVWTLDLRQRTLSRLTFETDGHDPIWSPDGRWVYFVHATGIWRRRADGSGNADSVFQGDYAQAIEVERDGTLLGASTAANGLFDLVVVSADSVRRSRPLLTAPYNEQAATLAPGGRWLAYTSDETGRDEVYVRSYPEGGDKVLVSQGGGGEPRWSPDGRTLYYQGEKDGLPYLIAAAVATAPEFAVTGRTPLFDISQFEPASPHANWDISPDGTRFALVNQGSLIEMVFVLNWPEEVRRQNGARGP